MPSTVISSMQYFKDRSVLRIRFVSGMIYDYLQVPEKIYVAMKNATSKGSFLNRHIKNYYSFQKVG